MVGSDKEAPALGHGSTFQKGKPGRSAFGAASPHASVSAGSQLWPPEPAAMSFQSNEQMIHDKVNLARLVRRLEKTVASEDWGTESLPPRVTWLKTQQTLQVRPHCVIVGVYTNERQNVET